MSNAALVDWVDVWTETGEHLRHHNDQFWRMARYYSSVIVLVLGGAGASLMSGLGPPVKLCLAAVLVTLGATLSLVAASVLDRQGKWVKKALEQRRFAAEKVDENFPLERPGKSTPDEKVPSEDKSITVTVPRSFRWIGYSFIALAVVLMMLFVAILPGLDPAFLELTPGVK